MKQILTIMIFIASNMLFSTIYYVTQNGNGNFDGSSWENAFPGDSLQTANNKCVEEGDQVWIAKGIYKPNSRAGFTDVEDKREYVFGFTYSLYGGFNGTENSIEERDIKANETILSGDIGIEGDNSDNCYNVLNYYRDADWSLSIIDGFTIKDGNADSTRFGGGAINLHKDNIIIRNCTFKDNKAYNYGGAIFSWSGFDGSFYDRFSVIIENCIFYNNSASLGGAIYARSTSTVVTNCTIVNNSADEGSGIYLHEPDKYLEGRHIGRNGVTNSIIWGNKGSEQIYRYYSVSYVKFNINAIEGGFDGFENYNLSSKNVGDPNSPYFTDPDNKDWSLQEISPCIDSGVFWNSNNTDIYLTPRPQGICNDLGAIEKVSSEPNASVPVLSTLPAENIGSTYATIKGNITDNGGTDIIAKGVKYSLTPGFDPETEGTLYRLIELINIGEFELLVTNLSPDTTYYFRAYCENRFGYAYSDEELTFTTNPILIIQLDENGIVYVKTDGTGNGSSWSDALNGNELQNAIGDTTVTEIWVAKGKYIPTGWPHIDLSHGTTEREKHFRLLNKKKIFGGFAGYENSLSQRDIKNNETILSGDIGVEGYAGDNCYHVVYNGGTKHDGSILDGFTIQDGNADGSIRGGSLLGGGIYNWYSSPKISNCLIRNNHAIVGGGISNGAAPCYPIIEYSIITENTAVMNGGGIYSEGAYPTIKNCLIYGNNALESGGGIYHWAEINVFLESDTLRVFNSTIANNTAPLGGSNVHIKSDNTYGDNYEIFQNSVIWSSDSSSFVFEYEWYFGPLQTISHCAITGGYDGDGNIDLSPNNAGDPNSPYFSDPDRNHWWIQETSPLRNAGIWTDDVPLFDIAGFPRGEFPSIGCYEYDPTSIEEGESSLPVTTKLYQNYPNPFNPATNIKFTLARSGKVELTVYNVLGQVVAKLVEKDLKAGNHSVVFNADALNSGVYYYTLEVDGKKMTKRMLMVK